MDGADHGWRIPALLLITAQLHQLFVVLSELKADLCQECAGPC